MPLEQELIDLMLDTIVLERATTKDKFAKFNYEVAAHPRCQIVRMNKRALTEAGRETTSTLQCILADPTLDVTVNDRLTLSDGSTPAIIEIDAVKDDEGPYYLEIRA